MIHIQAVLRVKSVFVGCVFAAIPLAKAASQEKAKPAVLSEASIQKPPSKFPLKIPESGPVALQLQILLDRAGFSPGVMDGTWGINAAKAVTFFAKPDDPARLNGDSPPKVVSIDESSYHRLRSAAGSRPLVRWYTVSSSDLKGPFTPIPASVYNQAKLPCLCYSSPTEALGEKFHTSPKFLAQLNPKVKFASLEPGTKLLVPNVDDDGSVSPRDTAIAARLIISKKGYWTQALDARGNIIYHFPSTLGAGYDPSPTGDFKVSYVSFDPAYKYQPKLFAEVPDDQPQAMLPAGPNSPVGVVWMSLSKPHYGIHGTSSPETIGYANSHGCVRLTNWDALRLSYILLDGTPVQFK
jgi:lipoprotein-anchoring transpeptidase ErfK/SrfK